MKNNRLVSLVFGAMIVFGASAGATTYYVDQSNLNPDEPYNTAFGAAQTIDVVLPYTMDGDQVLVMAGTYLLGAELEVTNAIEIVSANGPETTIINGGGGTCFDLDTSACVISGFTVSNGINAITCDDTTPVVTNCVIIGNTSGLYKGTAIDCIFENNTSSYGGGANSSIAIGCTFVGNSATDTGGGLSSGSATNCIFRNNTANRGGGSYNVTASHCSFIDNVSRAVGGGMYRGTAKQCIFNGNSAADTGGATYQTTLTHCTVTWNTAFNSGGGLYGGTAYNCIIWYNSALTRGDNVEGGTQAYYSCLPEVFGTECITNTPLLTSISHISTNSPCIGMGNPAYSSGTDIDGQPWQATPSMGCDEIVGGTVTGPIVPTLTGPSQICTGQDVYFRADFKGAITRDQITTGTGFIGTHMFKPFTLRWSSPGYYNVVLTGYNNDYPGGVSVTNVVEVRAPAQCTVYVKTTGHNINDGQSWANAKQSIQAAVDAQQFAGGLVLVSNGTYLVSTAILVDKEIRIESLSGTDQTTIQGDNHHRIFNLGRSHCTLEGFTLTKGGGYSANSGSNGGGAVYCDSPDPLVKNCVLFDNYSNGGGAMWRGTANNCVFINNSGGNGPGAMKDGIANDCLFENNQGLGGGSGGGAMGGGVANRCVFKNNTNAKAGGAMYGGVANDCQFLGNSSDNSGGAMYSGTAINCVFNGNKSKVNGGGTCNTVATHCTTTANRAINGGGMYGGTANNCIVYFNTALASGNDLLSTTARHTCSPDLEDGTDGNMTDSPMLITASHVDYTSPCVGAGDPAYSTGTDIDGQSWGAPPSMGCDEPAASPAGDLAITIEGPSDIPAGFEAFFDVEIQGELSDDSIDTGDGFTGIRGGVRSFGHSWTTPGYYNMVVTAYNTDHPGGYSVTKQIHISDADFAAIYVATNGSDGADGRSWANAKQTIQAGIEAQELPGGQVILADGVYEVNATILVEKEIQLIGLNGAENTIIDGGSSNRYTGVAILDIADNHTTVSGITFRNGNDRNSNKYYSGGGIFCNYSLSPKIYNCVFESNAATEGGAMAYGVATDCVFTNNWCLSGNGGGLYYGRAIGCEFIGNYCRDAGGGMYGGIATECIFTENGTDTTGLSYGNGGGMSHGTANFCTFTRNDSNGYGGGLNEGTANDCRFIENKAIHGGGGTRNSVANRCYFTGNLSINSGGGMNGGTANSCSFAGNKASQHGGGAAHTTLTHCTLTGNIAEQSSGGLYYGSAYNCIIWGNSAPLTPEIYSINSAHYSCSPALTHGHQNCITNNPALVSASHIAVDSPCLHQADPSQGTATDIDGAAWFSAPSMGCDEPDMALTDFVEMSLNGPTHVLEDVRVPYIPRFEGETKQTVIDFADGVRVTNAIGSITHAWDNPGDYDVVMTAFNLDNPQGVAFTQRVVVASSFDTSLHVDPAGDDTNHGLNWTAPKATIQAAVDAQNIYGGNVFIRGTYAISEPINVDKPIHLWGGYDDGAVIDAGGSNRCFNLGYSDCKLELLTMINGSALVSGDTEGGGVYCLTRAPVLTNCVITDCTAYYGGGVFNGTVVACVISNNVATSQGGGAKGSRLIISTISGNTAISGGGLMSADAERCLIEGNRTTGNGGGMYLGTANSCVISGNTADGQAGGVYKTTLNNCTVAHNSANYYGGVYSSTIRNSIVWYNTATNSGNNIVSSALRNSCCPDTTHGSNGNITNAPLFVAHAPDFLIRGSGYYLSPISPCINAGDNSYAETDRDFNGWDRIQYGTVEIGAIEGWVSNGDYDGDGIGDAWELENFGGVTNAVASDNADTDPHNNYEEYVAGTDPLDGLDYLHITEQEITDNEVIVHWEAKAGRAYDVAWAETLTNEYDFIGFNLYYPIDSYADTNHSDKASGFYKIRVKN